MKSWSDYNLSPHESGTSYIADLVDSLSNHNTLRQHVMKAMKRHPGRWVLVYSGANAAFSRQGFGSVKAITKGIGSRQTVDGVVYYRRHVRIYAHDGSNTDPDVLAEQAENLPSPTFDVPLDMWVQRIRLPAIDMTDGGFNWTQQELDEATNAAMASLRQGVPLSQIHTRQTLARKKKYQQCS